MSLIFGAGGGEESSGSSRTPVEAEDSLQSRAMLSLLDLLGEGQIGGLVNGAQSIFFNDTPLQNADGTWNYQGITFDSRTGTQNQEMIPGFTTVESPFNVGVQVKAATAHTVTITNPNASAVRVVVTLPSLMAQDQSTGDVNGTAVQYKFSIATNNGPFVDIGADTVWGVAGTWGTEDGMLTASRTTPGAGLAATFKLSGKGSMVVQPEEYVGGAWVAVGGQRTLEYSEPLYFDPTSGVVPVTVADNSATTVTSTRAEKLRLRVLSVVGAPNVVINPATGMPMDWGYETDPTLASGDIKELQVTSICTVSGKTRSRYQRAHVIQLPEGTLWQLRMTRLTPDSTSSALSNDTYFDSYVEIVDARLSYPNSALVAFSVDSSQFNQIPNRAYLVNGLIIRVPSNYDPTTRNYTGVWDGSFKLASSDNPAWVMYDLLTSERYGMGKFLSANQVDKAKLYAIGRYCDQPVPDGFGGWEPRFTCNTVITQQADAYKLIADLSSVFRGMGFWDGGQVSFMQDSPAESEMVFSPANVIDGLFTYTGSARKDRHSIAMITWNNPANGYKQEIEYVENAEMLQRYGVRKLETVAFGCTSRGQAHRAGLWMLYTEQYESDLVQFKVGIVAAMVLPGDIVSIHDTYRAGKRMGGRIVAATTQSVTLDAPVTISEPLARLSLRLPSGEFEDRVILEGAGEYGTLMWDTPLSEVPLPNSVWLLAEPNLQPMLARVVSVAQDGTKTTEFVISAVEHNPEKYKAIEGIKLEPPAPGLAYPGIIGELEVIEATYVPSPGVLAYKMLVSWVGNRATYEFKYRLNPSAPVTAIPLPGVTPSALSNWTEANSKVPAAEVLSVTRGDIYELVCVGVRSDGTKTKPITLNHLVSADVSTYPVGAVTGGEFFWNGRDCKISWNFNSATSSYEFGSEPTGADDGNLDPTFKDYEIKVFDKTGKKLRRTEYVTTNTYTYTYDKNHEDGLTRHIHVQVRQRNTLNKFGKAFVVDCENPPPKCTGVTVVPKYDSITFAYEQNGDPDFSGCVIYLSQTESEVESMSDACVAYDGPDSSIVATGLMFNADYYYRVLPYDLFGKAETTPSDVAHVKTPFMDIDAIAAGVLGASLLVPALRSRIDLIDAPNGVTGSVNQRLDDLSNMLAQQISTVAVSANNAAALVQQEQTARIQGDNALAYDVSTVQTTVGQHTTSIQQHASSINGLNAQYTVKIDNNGYVSGFGLASTSNNGVPTSEFIVNADKFAVITPGNPLARPFTIGTVNGITKTIISDALIGDAAINTAKIGDAAITTAKIKDLAVDTLKIGDHAVTIPVSAFAATPDVSVTLVLDQPATLFILGTMVCPWVTHIYLTRNGTELRQEIPNQYTLPALSYVESLPAGTYTYRFWGDLGQNTTLFVMAVKK